MVLIIIVLPCPSFCQLGSNVEAKSVFNDPLFITFADPEHSTGERRFMILGESAQGRLLVVAYTERNSVTRLISARVATRTRTESL
jgi:uncharacterized DUF497 family protein